METIRTNLQMIIQNISNMNKIVQQYIHEPIRSSVLVLILRLFLGMIIVDTIYSLAEIYFLELEVSFNAHQIIIAMMFITHFIKNIFLIHFVISSIAKWISNLCYINGLNLVKHEGIFNLKEKIIDLKQLRTVTIHQGFIGKLFHYGNITLTTSASGGYTDEVYLAEVDEPEKYKDFFQQCLEKSS